MSETTITLCFDHGKAFSWNSEDWHELRAKHRICGSLIGSITSFPRQNEFLGLPMQLLSEEAAMLIEKNICKLYELPDLCKEPYSDFKEKAKEVDKQILNEQVECLRNKRIEQLSQKIDIIVAGKKKKMLAKGEPINEAALNKDVMLQEEISRLTPLMPRHVLVQIPTQHPWPLEHKEVTIENLKPSILEGLGHVKYSVYKDLWEKGHYITSGTKFGGDFLVYPGDPVRFHAAFIVKCLLNPTTSLKPTELVAIGRLAVAVNKMAVLATCANSQVQYQTLQWHESVNS